MSTGAQLSLFETAGPAALPEHVEAIIAKPQPPTEDVVRITGNRLRVLERLRQGPTLNTELCSPDVGGMRFGARIHELEKLGFDIEVSRRDGGVFVYELISEPKKA